MSNKIQCLGNLTQAVRILEIAKKEFDNLYNDSQVRLPIEDCEFVNDRIKEIHNLMKEIKSINNQFEAIAAQNHAKLE